MNTNFEGKTSTGKDEWLTPPEIVRALGHFDLDPCAPINAPWRLANKCYTITDDGLKQPWHGRIWCNPPYSQIPMREFVRRCIEHRNATLLTFARTDTRLFHELIFPNATAILFIKGRLKFYHVNGKQADCAGAPSCLIAFDYYNAEMLRQSGIEGHCINLRNTPQH